MGFDMVQWIWMHAQWPNFIWQAEQLLPHLSAARLAQGKLLAIVHKISQDDFNELGAYILGEQAIDTSAIEGEYLNRDSVRSSIANRLGLEQAGIAGKPDRYVDGLLDMLLDATKNHQQPLTKDRLLGWHAALFPTGYSGMHKINVGQLRNPGLMQIVSGREGNPKVHYEAPPAERLADGLQAFLQWFNNEESIDGLLRAGLAHLWFELLHPFDDGNGRIGRAIIDLALSQEEGLDLRYYSLSSAIMGDRKNYYAVLGSTCRQGMDVTEWLIWFLQCLETAIQQSIAKIEDINLKARFWQQHVETELTQRQKKALNELLDAGQSGYVGQMTIRKYMHLTRTSRSTAGRELKDLVEKGCLKPTAEKGRSAAYEINWG